MEDFFEKFSTCDICLDKVCENNHKCDCLNCSIFNKCPKKLSATIRITNKCTQSCKHCCFDCSPKNNTHMSIETSLKLKKFIEENGIFDLNIMGGEIFCNPDYKEILSNIIPVSQVARIVTNGDWAENNGDEFASYLSTFKYLKVSVSNDKFHHNKNIYKAEEYLKKYNIRYNISCLNETESTMIPVGSAKYYTYGFYAMMGTYCTNPEHKYSFLIDETGLIYKCSFGSWHYAKIDEYLNGGFREKFKLFNTNFYKIFIANCDSCNNSYLRIAHTEDYKNIYQEK